MKDSLEINPFLTERNVELCRGRSEITRRSGLDMDGSLGNIVGDSGPDNIGVRSKWISWLIIFGFCIIWFAVTMLAIVLIFIVLALIGISDSYSIHLSISFSYLIAIPLTLLFMGFDKQLSDLSEKLTFESGKQAFALLLAIPILVTIVDFIVVIGYGIVYELTFGVPEVNTDIGVDWGSGPVALGLAITSTVILAPIAEELMFRGYLLDSIKKMHGDWVAVIISSLFFGLIHLDPYTIGMATIGGLIYGFIRIRTGSLWPSIIGHMMWNAVALVVTYL